MKKILQLIRPFREARKIFALFFALFLFAGNILAQTTVSYGWETTDDASQWTITNAIVATADQGNTGSYAGKINTNSTYVQFNEKVYVTSFSFAFKRTSNNNNYNVYIETSTDGETWEAVETYAMSSFLNGTYTTKTHEFDGTTQYYVRFHCNNTTAIRYVDDVTITYNAEAAVLDPSDLALSGNTELTFDLYDNADAQVIHYTTSSTGAVSVVENGYVTTVVDETNKTITVTPVAVTPSAQTITVNQAGDDNYASGSTTFTVTIADNTPFLGGDVTFDATVDKDLSNVAQGAGSITKSGVTFACDNGILGNGSEYRIYKNSTTTFSTENGTITNIAFTCTSNNPASNFGAMTGFTTDGSNGTWTGNATSVTFVASGAQVRATQIVVTVDLNAAPDPVIDAEDVIIDYDVTAGEIEYTITNEVNDGVLTAATEAEWLTIGTVGTTVPFSCDLNADAASRMATVTLTYTYGDEETVTKDVTVTQNGNPDVIFTTIPALFEAATSTATTALVTFDSWVVSGVSTNGKNVFVTDNDGNGFVIYNNQGGLGDTYSAGDVLSGTAVPCSLELFNGFAELTGVNAEDLTIVAGGTVSTSDIAMAELAGVNTGALVHYENLTCSVNNNKYSLTDGTTTLQVYNSLYAFDALEDGVSYNITGVYQQYNTTKEILPRSAADIEEVVVAIPSVTVTPATIDAPFAGAEGTLTITYENIPELMSFDYYFCNADGEELSEDPDWIYAAIQEDNGNYTVEYIIDANEGAARTAYFKVYTFAVDDLEEVYSIVTVNQAQYALDYATLPFEFDGGRADIETTNGLTQEGIDSDYGSSPKLKFNTTGDWMILHFNEQPGKLTFDIKGNSFSEGTFTVQTSEDGETYTDLATYTELGSTQDEEFTNLGANVRYIKWVYTEKVNGNVALGNIVLLAPSVEPAILVDNTPISIGYEGGEGTITVTYENLGEEPLADVIFVAEDGETATYEWIEAELDDNYNVHYVVEANEGEARTAYLKVYALDDNSNDVYSDLITITQEAFVAPATGDDYVLLTGDLVEGDYVIYYNGYAMKNTVENDRLSYVLVTPDQDVITTDDASIVWHIAPSGEYWTIYSADTQAYAASTGVKNKAQMLEDGTDDKALWTVSDAFEFVNKANAAANINANLRNNGTYGFACYATTTGGALSLYKKATSTVLCGIVLNEPDYMWEETFESYTVEHTDGGFTNYLPGCWTLVKEYTGASPDLNNIGLGVDTLPQVFYYPSFDASTGNQTLRMKFHSLLAMPELDESVDMSRLHLSMWVRQPQTYYHLQVGVLTDLADDSTFEPLVDIDNESTDMEHIELDFSRYQGEGRYIAFKNLGGSSRNPYCTQYLDDIVLTYNAAPAECGISELYYEEDFEGYTINPGATGVEPDCWEVIDEISALDFSTKPQLYAGFNTTEGGNYTLRMLNRCVYAMPELSSDIDVNTLTMTFNLRQPKAVYRLQVGVLDADNNFELVEEIDNASADMEDVRVDFTDYTGNGHRIAFRNVLNGRHYKYSYNYLDDIHIDLTANMPAPEPTKSISDMTDGADEYLNRIAVYPNPTTGMLHIDAVDVQKVECYNQMGKLVGVYDNVNELNISELANGVYMLRITVPQGVTMRKVVKR